MSSRTAAKVAPTFLLRAGIALLWAGLIVGSAIIASLVGIHFVGSVEGWERWLRDHANHFLAWRLCLYAATAYGWYRLRARRMRTGSCHRASRRAEIAAVATIALLEISQWFPSL